MKDYYFFLSLSLKNNINNFFKFIFSILIIENYLFSLENIEYFLFFNEKLNYNNMLLNYLLIITFHLIV